MNCLKYIFRDMKRLVVAMLVSLMPICGIGAQTWTDITESVIMNSDFGSGTASDWEVSVANAWNKGYQGASYSNGGTRISGFIEAWLANWAGNLGSGYIRQNARLQSGKYRLEADCIANFQGDSRTVSGVYLFAEMSDGTRSLTEVSTGNGAPQHFTLDFSVAKADVVQFGLLLDNSDANWIAADNFVLKFNGTVIDCKSVSFTPSSMTLDLKETAQFTTKCSPSNATLINYKYVSSNALVASVDKNGTVTAKGGGDAVIQAQTADGKVLGELPVHVNLPEVHPEAIVINEIQACNLDMFLDPSMNYGSWIEIYNPTDQSTGIGGLYISDDASDLKKWKLRDDLGTVPAHGYKNIWFDHFGIWKEGELTQVNFKLNYDGGTIIISDGTTVIAQQTYPKAVVRTSYARKADGGDEWAVSASPSPEATNAGMTFAATQLAAPKIDTEGSFSSSFPLTVMISGVASGAKVRYTTDGTTPTANSSAATVVSSSAGTCKVTLNEAAVLRIRMFCDGYLPSAVVTRSFIKDDTDRPIISIATDPDNLYSTERGLFEKGPNGRAGNGQNDNCNWNMEWDRPVNFEYITSGKEYVLNQEVDMSMCGGWSRANSPHSFKLKAAKYYDGLNSLDYQFFDGKPYLKHKVLQIRNGGSGDKLRDSSLQEIMRRSGLYIDTQAWKPVRVYINGKYYADLNMREPNNKHFAYANYGIDTDLMDQFEMSPDSGYVQMAGTKESFNRLLELSANASDALTYEQIGELLDIDEYINYMACELYLGNWDWPQNNVKGFRDQNDGKFHFVVYDLDGAFSANISTFFGKKNYTFDSLRGEDAFGNSLWGQRQVEEIEVVTLFENLLNNSDFRRRFVDAMCVISGSVFDYDYAKSIIYEMADKVGGDAWSMSNNFNGRQDGYISQLQNDSRFGITTSAQQFSAKSNVDGAQMFINDIPVCTGQFGGKVFAPITLKAVAPSGYRFLGWRESSDASIDMITETVFSKSSNWNYDDTNTSLDGTAWKTTALTKSGKAPIGYDTNNSKSFNTKVGERYQTYYFNKSFTISDEVNASDIFTLNYTVDDAMVVYVNGQEAGRYNLTSGEVTFNTNGGWAQGNPDSGTMTLPSGLFRLGENMIAVEVHNYFNPSSSDIYWDASLSRSKSVTPVDGYYTTDESFELPATDGLNFVAEYEKLSDTELADNGTMPVKVNEISASNDMYVNDYFKKDDWFELYNTTDEEIDIAGMYLTDKETSPQKFQIPANDTQNTVIAPHGHLVLWASKRTNTGSQIHTNFKLGNDDGSVVMLTSQDGEWSDKLVYSAHGKKETVGLFPDGSNDVYHMYRPTIGGTNVVTSYAEYLYDNTPEPIDDRIFTLSLNEKWNWISHPLERNMAISEMNKNATRIVSQTQEAVLDDKLGWTGTLAELAPGAGYKVYMSADDEVEFGGPFFSEGNTIALHKGWNWIGYPVLGSQTVTAALSRFTASEGDQVVGQNGFATYEDGSWSGDLESFETGAAYLYKSAAPNSLSFAPVEATASSAKPRFYAQPFTPWTASSAAYPDVMGVVAKMVADGQEAESGNYSVGAFSEDGECRGTGKYIDGKLFITVYGNDGDRITFQAADAQTGIVYEVTETLDFAQEVKGSRKAPLALHIGVPTGIASLKMCSVLESVAFYNLNGTYAGATKNSLLPGFYIERVTLIDGSSISKKIIVK